MKQTNRRLVVVLGMHRSGTSAVTRALAFLGVGLGDDMHPAGFDNPKGFWEDISILEINEQLLAIENSAYDRMGGAWASFDTDAEALKKRAVELVIRKLAECGGIWGFKDPRTCRLLSFWLEVFQIVNCQVDFVIVSRNPASVVDSLSVRNGIPPEKSYILWMQHMLPALIDTRGRNRVVVDYDCLLDEPYKQLVRIAQALGLPAPVEGDQVVQEFTGQFLEAGLRHSHYSIDDLRADARAWEKVVTLYQFLFRFACDLERLDSPHIEESLNKLNKDLFSLVPLVNYANSLEDVRNELWAVISHYEAMREKEAAEREKVMAEHEKEMAEREKEMAEHEKEMAEHEKEMAEHEKEMAEHEKEMAEHEKEMAEREKEMAEREKEMAEREKEMAEREKEMAEREKEMVKCDARIAQGLGESSMFLITIRKAMARVVRSIWRRLPGSPRFKLRCKNWLFSKLPFFFRRTGVYRAWSVANNPLAEHVYAVPASLYVPRLQGVPLKNKPVKLICFYLPQFHAIPENDAWWGEGFTEWTNVQPAQPYFEGHYQPHVPGELGYYNLLDPAVQRRQVELAKLYGIEGFCFYFYWFGGKRLLEAPIENYLNDKSLDLPFCLCWANENWSRRWDGLDSEILMKQQHSPEDDLAFIRYVALYMLDARYIRIQGKPLLLVYRPSLLPSALATTQRWRDWCRNNGVGEIYLAYTQSFETEDPAIYGFDAAIEFPPNNSSPPNITDRVVPVRKDFEGTVYDWRVFVRRSEEYKQFGYKLFRSVCPSWDNTARRKNRGTIFLNSSPRLYQRWLQNAINHTIKAFPDSDERLIFVNAWNEWAEGAHLEPDAQYGYAYLQATRDALLNTREHQGAGSILLVTHDCHPHGAQFLILETAKQFRDCGLTVYVLALGGGRLLGDFAQVGETLDAEAAGAEVVDEFLSTIRAKGVSWAITSTVVSGGVVPRLKESGFRVLSLIHELPGVISSMGQEGNARLIARHADKVVFPADLVYRCFGEIAPIDSDKAEIRHQGVLRKNPYKGRKSEAHRIVREKHNLPMDCQIVLNIAYMDHRKGPDLFVEMAALVLHQCPRAIFIWVGHVEREMEQKVIARIAELGLGGRVLLAGFEREPLAYYAAASVFALTSREDPFPNVVLESVEAGVPVVAFAGVSGAADFVLAHGGRLARYPDVNDYADQVAALLNGPSVELQGADISLRKYALDLLHYLDGFPRVSVIVPNYNYARYIVQRLDSIKNQSFPIYEVIVLDDASNDASDEVIAEYIERNGGEIRIIQNDKNSGSVFRQWKKGVDSCKGDLVWIAEADDLSEEGFLQELVPAFSDGRLVLAYSQSKQIDEAGQILADSYIEYALGASNCCLTDYCRDGREEIAKSMCIKNTIPNVSAVLFRRQALLEALGETAESLYGLKVAGDWLVYLHILLKGKICHSKKSLNLHRRHAGSVTGSLQKQRHVQEIMQMQKLAISLVSPPEEVVRLAEDYVDQVCDQFRVARPKANDVHGVAADAL